MARFTMVKAIGVAQLLLSCSFATYINRRQASSSSMALLTTISDGQIQAPYTPTSTAGVTTELLTATIISDTTLAPSQPTTIVSSDLPAGGIVYETTTTSIPLQTATVVAGITSTNTLLPASSGGVIVATTTIQSSIPLQTETVVAGITSTSTLPLPTSSGVLVATTTIPALIQSTTVTSYEYTTASSGTSTIPFGAIIGATTSSATPLVITTTSITSTATPTSTVAVLPLSATAHTPVTHTAGFKAGIAIAAIVAAALLLGLLFCCCCGLPAFLGGRKRRAPPPPPPPPPPMRYVAPPPPVMAPAPPVADPAAPFLLAGGALGARALAGRVADAPASTVGELSTPLVAGGIPPRRFPGANQPHLGPQLVPTGMVPAPQRSMFPAVRMAPSQQYMPVPYTDMEPEPMSYGPMNPASPVSSGRRTAWQNAARTSPPRRSPVTYV